MNFSLLSVPSLDARTSAFRARDVVTDGSSVFEATASGLTVRLSELLAGAPANGRRSIAVFADTFIIDREQNRHAGTNVGAADVLAHQAPRTDDHSAVGVTQNNLRAHVDKLVDKE